MIQLAMVLSPVASVRVGRFEKAIVMLERFPYEGIQLSKAKLQDCAEFLVSKSLCMAGIVDNAAMDSFVLVDMGFKPENNSWVLLAELICREKNLLSAFELLDELAKQSHFR
ncbi:hypothetical protein FEM48_Zijuj01G0000800 [Ziziphus jujuba var. spinosa]|uniref:Pentatricopeptide repeat-containing protein n=1 Tax=Ziziphus jujuba var. spinosa TaxID=714518 RepID=A0A978VXZ5_ZIZJJ|nr:hypothetical protein FEM48_Zijuj01G0000800 [Ziziphus jujuba var. spinosa]